MGLPCKDSHLNLCYCADIWRLYSELSLLWLFVPFEKLRKVEILHLTHSPPPTFNSFAFMLYNPITSEGNAYCQFSAEAQKPKTFRVAAVYAQNFSGRSARIHFQTDFKLSGQFLNRLDSF